MWGGNRARHIRGVALTRGQHLLEFSGFIREGLKLDAFAINLHNIATRTTLEQFFQRGWCLVV
jgi:hypothetical protein